jgi:putative metallohydrolase (TIGR04338 family)
MSQADPQQYRLYNAERIFDDSNAVKHFRSLGEMTEFVNTIVKHEWWQERCDVKEVKVFLGRKDSNKAKAYSAGSMWRGVVQKVPFITIPPSWAATDVVVIHELAHICVGNKHRHNPVYAACYLDMLGKFSGSWMKKALQESFDENQVAYNVGAATATTRRIVAQQVAKEKQEQAKKQEQLRKKAEAEAYLHMLSKYTGRAF